MSPPEPQPPSQPKPATRGEPRRIASEQLLGPVGLAIIVHRGREYHLRQTQNGKLILTA